VPPGAIDVAISIRALKRFVCERFGVESEDFDLGRVYPGLRGKGRETFGGGRKVAIVGAGPAGLSCAHELALMGFAPDRIRGAEPGGRMLVLGVPEYRLPREIIQAENQGHRVARGGDSLQPPAGARLSPPGSGSTSQADIL